MATALPAERIAMDRDDAELRRLRNGVVALEDDKQLLEERLGFASREVERIRQKLLDSKPSLQTAPPGGRRVDVEAIAPAELEAAVALLRRVTPLTLAS